VTDGAGQLLGRGPKRCVPPEPEHRRGREQSQDAEEREYDGELDEPEAPRV
jgi:hypothetical protein